MTGPGRCQLIIRSVARSRSPMRGRSRMFRADPGAAQAGAIRSRPRSPSVFLGTRVRSIRGSYDRSCLDGACPVTLADTVAGPNRRRLSCVQPQLAVPRSGHESVRTAGAELSCKHDKVSTVLGISRLCVSHFWMGHALIHVRSDLGLICCRRGLLAAWRASLVRRDYQKPRAMPQ